MNHDLHSALKQHFGFDTFKGNQEAIMRSEEHTSELQSQ